MKKIKIKKERTIAQKLENILTPIREREKK